MRYGGKVGNFGFMNPPRVQREDYIDFLIATPKLCSATEASRVQPSQTRPPAHDAFSRLLHRLEPDPDTLWQEAQTQVNRTDGVLVADDSTLDKPYAKAIELVGRHWSGKHYGGPQKLDHRIDFLPVVFWRFPTMSKTNRTHTPVFKAQVALAALKGDRTISQIAAHFQIHVNLVAHWKKQLLQGAANIFAPAGKGLPPPDDAKQAERYEQIGRLQVELAFVKKKSPSLG